MARISISWRLLMLAAVMLLSASAQAVCPSLCIGPSTTGVRNCGIGQLCGCYSSSSVGAWYARLNSTSGCGYCSSTFWTDTFCACDGNYASQCCGNGNCGDPTCCVPPSTSPSSSHTGTPSPSHTGTPSSSNTGTPSPSHTGTQSSSHTGTPSSSPTGTRTSSMTRARANTLSHMNTPSKAPSKSTSPSYTSIMTHIFNPPCGHGGLCHPTRSRTPAPYYATHTRTRKAK